VVCSWKYRPRDDSDLEGDTSVTEVGNDPLVPETIEPIPIVTDAVIVPPELNDSPPPLTFAAPSTVEDEMVTSPLLWSDATSWLFY